MNNKDILYLLLLGPIIFISLIFAAGTNQNSSNSSKKNHALYHALYWKKGSPSEQILVTITSERSLTVSYMNTKLLVQVCYAI